MNRITKETKKRNKKNKPARTKALEINCEKSEKKMGVRVIMEIRFESNDGIQKINETLAVESEGTSLAKSEEKTI